MNRNQRVSIAHETLDIIKQGFYVTESGKRIEIKDQLEQAVAQACCYRPEDFLLLEQRPMANPGQRETLFKVINATTLDAIKMLYDRKLATVACLNFASAKNPGGGFLNGSQAQEESLARSSTLYPTLLKNQLYYERNRKAGTSLYTDHMIYSPHVLVFRDDDGALLEQPFVTTVVTSPAVNAGAVKKNEPRNVEQLIPVMQKRMRRFLLLCKDRQLTNLVLGAWCMGMRCLHERSTGDCKDVVPTTG